MSVQFLVCGKGLLAALRAEPQRRGSQGDPAAECGTFDKMAGNLEVCSSRAGARSAIHGHLENAGARAGAE